MSDDLQPHLGFNKNPDEIFTDTGTVATIYWGNFRLEASFGTDSGIISAKGVEKHYRAYIELFQHNSRFGIPEAIYNDIFELFSPTLKEYIFRFQAAICKKIDVEKYHSEIMREFNKWKNETIVEEIIT